MVLPGRYGLEERRKKGKALNHILTKSLSVSDIFPNITFSRTYLPSHYYGCTEYSIGILCGPNSRPNNVLYSTEK